MTEELINESSFKHEGFEVHSEVYLETVDMAYCTREDKQYKLRIEIKDPFTNYCKSYINICNIENIGPYAKKRSVLDILLRREAKYPDDAYRSIYDFIFSNFLDNFEDFRSHLDDINSGDMSVHNEKEQVELAFDQLENL